MQLNSYSDVRKLLDDFVTAHDIDVIGSRHGSFWSDLSYDQFVNGDVPNVTSVRILVPGSSDQSNVIRILRGPLTINGRTYRRMPGGGPYLPDDLIAAIADWIDRNCPNP